MRLQRTVALRWLLAMLLAVGLVMALRPLAPHASPETWFRHSDKLVHITFFAIAWWLGVQAGAHPGWRLGLGLLTYGGVMELAQAVLTSGRGASLSDVAADGVGLLLGAALTWWSARRGRSAGQPQEHRR